MQSFIETIKTRIVSKQPNRTEEEFHKLLQRSFEVLATYPLRLTYVSSEPMPDIKLKSPMLFLSRRLSSEELPHPLPSDAIQFFETCQGVYQDYMITLDNLLDECFIQSDIDMLKDLINKNKNAVILCWSNTSIILNHILKDMDGLEDLYVVTFGSPILIPSNNFKCLNIHHEDDWILGFHESLFIKEQQEKDKVCTYVDSKERVYKYLKLSRNYFDKNSDPHESYYVLL